MVDVLAPRIVDPKNSGCVSDVFEYSEQVGGIPHLAFAPTDIPNCALASFSLIPFPTRTSHRPEAASGRALGGSSEADRVGGISELFYPATGYSGRARRPRRSRRSRRPCGPGGPWGPPGLDVMCCDASFWFAHHKYYQHLPGASAVLCEFVTRSPVLDDHDPGTLASNGGHSEFGFSCFIRPPILRQPHSC